jgi:hypothetical protein
VYRLQETKKPYHLRKNIPFLSWMNSWKRAVVFSKIDLRASLPKINMIELMVRISVNPNPPKLSPLSSRVIGFR